MNEFRFTKEELEIIYLNLCVNPKTADILNKLQVIIARLKIAEVLE